jgi:hypothetical protein
MTNRRALIRNATIRVRISPTPRRQAIALVPFDSAAYSDGMSQTVREVDPSQLRLPPSRAGGADLWKLHQQMRKFGSSKDGMPPIFVYEDPDGLLEIIDGVTRATRIAKLAPGTTVPVVVIGRYRGSRDNSPSVKDRL